MCVCVLLQEATRFAEYLTNQFNSSDWHLVENLLPNVDCGHQDSADWFTHSLGLLTAWDWKNT